MRAKAIFCADRRLVSTRQKSIAAETHVDDVLKLAENGSHRGGEEEHGEETLQGDVVH